MKKLILFTAFLLFASTIYSGTADSLAPKLKKKSERENNWSINLGFSDHGFGFGATKYFSLSRDVAFVGGLMFSQAKDDREFDQNDMYGNSFTPFKVNRLFLFPMVNLGMQFRLFRNDVSDNMRPFVNFGISPTVVMYTPYNESFFSSFKYARAKYTMGGYVGVGLDYISSKTSGLSFNFRYYYNRVLGEGIQSLSTEEMTNFGGIYFVFSYNFLH